MMADFMPAALFARPNTSMTSFDVVTLRGERVQSVDTVQYEKIVAV